MALEQTSQLSIIAQSLQTAEITTGNVATVNDAYVSSSFTENGLTKGAKAPIGAALYLSDSVGRRFKFRYVRLNSTVPPTLIVGPVYWKDNTFTVVTAVESEALYGVNSIAGLLLNVNAANGNYVWIQTFGHAPAVPSPLYTAAGDGIIGAAGNQQLARVAANTAPTNQLLGWAETAVAAGVFDLFINVEQ
jgi:hypothetical protein